MRIQSEITAHSGSDTLHAHRHTQGYVALVLEGGYNELSADGAWHLEPGHAVVHPPHHLHGNSFSGSTKVLNLYIPAPQACADEFQRYCVIPDDHADEILRARHDHVALRDALRNAAQLCSQQPGDWVDAMALELATDSNMRIAGLARKYRVTPEHASRKFRQRYFMSPSTFRAERRFRRALDLMRRTQRSLSEIAHIAGYSDQAHFCRNCVAITGSSPGVVRRMLMSHQIYSRPAARNDLD